MKYKNIGDLKVSRVCLGCMGFGDASRWQHKWVLPYEKSANIIKTALENGINFFDTAMIYSGGSSEEYLGRAIKEYGKRDDVVIATKFLPRSKDEIDANISVKTHILNSLDESLKRLKLQYIDLFIYHMWDYHSPMSEIMHTLDETIKSGKVRHLGISNCYAWQLAKANAYARANGLTPFISMQGHYNLIFREEEREMIPFCKDENIALTPYSALAAGRLARVANKQTTRKTLDEIAKNKYDNSADQDAIIINRVGEIAKNRDVAMSEIAISWLISKTISPIIGMTKQEHVKNAINAIDIELSNDEISYLEAPYVPHALVGVMGDEKYRNPL